MAKKARKSATQQARQTFDIHVSYGDQKAEELLANSLRGILRSRPDLLNNTHSADHKSNDSK